MGAVASEPELGVGVGVAKVQGPPKHICHCRMRVLEMSSNMFLLDPRFVEYGLGDLDINVYRGCMGVVPCRTGTMSFPVVKTWCSLVVKLRPAVVTGAAHC